MKTITYAILITALFAVSVLAQNAMKTETSKTETQANKSSAPSQKDRAGEEEIVYEIIFRRIIGFWNLRKDDNSKVYYLQVSGNENPSENLLKKFADSKVPVKKISELGSSDSIILSLDEELSKVGGVIFSISKLQWKNENEVTLYAESYIGNLGINGCDYTLRKENGTWKIIAEEKCYVS